jgi:hypothetical protein
VGSDAIFVRQGSQLEPIHFDLGRQFEKVESLGMRTLTHNDRTIRQFELYRCRNLLPMERWAKADSSR